MWPKKLLISISSHAQHAVFAQNICSFRAFRFPDTKHFNFSIVQITHVWPVCVRSLCCCFCLLSDAIDFWAHSYHSHTVFRCTFLHRENSFAYFYHTRSQYVVHAFHRSHAPSNFHTQPYIIFARVFYILRFYFSLLLSFLASSSLCIHLILSTRASRNALIMCSKLFKSSSVVNDRAHKGKTLTTRKNKNIETLHTLTLTLILCGFTQMWDNFVISKCKRNRSNKKNDAQQKNGE